MFSKLQCGYFKFISGSGLLPDSSRFRYPVVQTFEDFSQQNKVGIPTV